MKGLLLKDLYSIWKYCWSYFAMILVFAVVTVFGDKNPIFVYYPCMFIGMLPMNLQSFDEKEKWHIYADTMPCTRAQVVSGKYIVGLITAAVGLAAAAVSQALHMRLAGSFSAEEYVRTLLGVASCSLAFPSLILPFVFKLGPEKGRILYMAIVGAGIAVFFSLSGIFITPNLPDSHFAALAAAAVLVLYGLSWLLSIRFYQKREL